ncbi:hypothetical protein ACISK3_18205 [Morganella morganii]
MAREFKLSLLFSARDEASKSITRALRETVKETQKAEQAQEKLNRRQKDHGAGCHQSGARQDGGHEAPVQGI